MTFEALQRAARAKKIPPVVVLQGPEEFLRRRGIELIAKSTGATLLRLRGEEATWAHVGGEIVGRSLFEPARVVAVIEADDWIRANRESLDQYLETPSRQAILAIDLHDGRTGVPKHANLLKVECAVLTPDMIECLARDAVEERGKRIEADACRELARRISDRHEAMDAELEKLALAAGTRDSITLEDVQTHVEDGETFESFDLVNAVSAGRRDQALALAHRLLEQGIAPQMLIGSLAWHFRKLAEVRAKIDQGTPPDRACSASGVRFRVREFAEAGRKTPMTEIVRCHQSLLSTDLALKSTGASQDLLVDRLLFELTSAVGKR